MIVLGVDESSTIDRQAEDTVPRRTITCAFQSSSRQMGRKVDTLKFEPHREAKAKNESEKRKKSEKI
jgi:hypothetical protein